MRADVRTLFGFPQIQLIRSDGGASRVDVDFGADSIREWARVVWEVRMETGRRLSPVLDHDQLAASAGGDVELVRELALLYTTDAAQQLVALGRSVLGESLEDVASYAHALKGSSAAVGAKECAECFGRLEAAARSGDRTKVLLLHEAAESAYERAEKELQQIAA